MLASISPVGEASRKQRWAVTVTAFTVSSTFAGGLLGAVLGGTGWLVGLRGGGPAVLAVFAAAALLGAAADLGRPRRWSSGWRRQVDEGWLIEYRGWAYGAGYGFQLGAAVLTIVPSSITYVVLLAAALTGRPATGALVGATFGFVRAVPLLLTVGIRTPEALRRLHRRIHAAAQPVTRTTVAAQAGMAGLATFAAARALTG